MLKAGFHAVAGVPVPFQGRNIGAINLYAATTRAWTTDEFAAARVLADLAGGYLINAHLLAEAQTLAAQLQHALESRIIIEQAKGVMTGLHGMTPDAAFQVLRSYARSNQLKIKDVAHDIVVGRTDLLGGGTDAGKPGGVAG